MANIKTFKFGLMNDEEILAISVAEITKPCLRIERGSVYDPRMGVTEGTKCPTCCKDGWDCVGHFGHIELAVPIIVFYREAVLFARKFCFECGDVLKCVKTKCLPSSHAICPVCKAQQPIIKLQDASDPQMMKLVAKKKNGLESVITPAELAGVFDNIKDKALRECNIDPEMFRPRNLILTKFPVIPPCCRPKTTHGGVYSDDDLSIFLSQIVKVNNRIKALPAGSPDIANLADILKLKILCYVDNTKGKVTHNTNHKAMTGIKERLSKKTGVLRQNMMGKRRDQTARTVVGPDGTLPLDVVGVPEEIANNLTMPVRVTPFNLAKYINATNVLMIKRNDQYYKFSAVKVQVGDIVERLLEDGDPVILNRQPTLHRNSMLGMKVKRLPGKTLRVNLAVTTGFNMDFDGDEGNLYLPQNEEARAETLELMNPKKVILSDRSESAEIVHAQDALLGAYLMTKDGGEYVDPEVYALCVETLDRPDAHNRQGGSSKTLFELLLPKDFNYDSSTLTVRNGVIVKGFVSKPTLRNGRDSLVRLICLEYGGEVAKTFIDGLHFLTNVWLSSRPFSIGYKDCADFVVPGPEIVTEKFIEAERAHRSDLLPAFKEQSISLALNAARDIGARIVKSTLKPTNRLATMVEAGSKGDYFNLVQISCMLGQQYVNGQRPKFCTDQCTRALPHYPRVHADVNKKYESKGFVKNSFLKGLNPQELFFHAKSGREGMINTSQTTGVTGYAERRMVKLNEDLIVSYDGSIRDAHGMIIQHVYGGDGLCPQNCYKAGEPISFKRLCAKLNGPGTPFEVDLDKVLMHFDPCLGAPEPIRTKLLAKHIETIKQGAFKYPPANDKREEWMDAVNKAYVGALAVPGDAVGVVCAQAIGAKQTQQTLNTFHQAGKLTESGYRKFGELLSLTQRPKQRSCVVHLKDRHDDPTKLRDLLGSVFISKSLSSLLTKDFLTVNRSENGTSIDVALNPDILYSYRITPAHVCVTVSKRFELPHFVTKPMLCGFSLSWKGSCDISRIVHDLLKLNVGDVQGIEGYNLYKHNDVWIVQTDGSNINRLLSNPAVQNVSSDDIWDVYNTLGLAAVRKKLRDLTKVCVGGGVHSAHINLLVDRMTSKGKPMPVDRYTMRTCDVGPLSRAAFEESLDILISSAITTEIEYNKGVGASIIAGTRVRVGTGYFDLGIDRKILQDVIEG